MITSKRTVLAIIFLVSGMMLIYSSFTVSDVNAENLRPIPDYSATSLEGESVSLSDLNGKVVLINVWATWCEPCREEMPDLQKLQDKFFDDDFVVIGVSVDDKGSIPMIKNFLQSQNISYTAWHDPDNEFQYAFRTIGVPESVLISKDGMILYQWKGAFEPMSQNTISRVESALNNIQFEENTSDSIFISDLGLNFVVAFSAGLLSFLSPCVLPLIPVYASFLTGLSVNDLSQKNNSAQQKLRMTTMKRGLMFVLGFSSIFIVLGSTVGYAGSIFLDASIWIERIGGVVLIILGLHLIGIFKIPWLERQLKFDLSKKSSGKAGTFFVGMAFGAGWTPCIGPILAGILTIAASSSSISTGASLLTVYSAGLTIPFLLSAFALDRFLIFFDRIKSKMMWIERISGLLLVGVGILLLTGSMAVLSNYFNSYT
ncbi:MAG: redoxin domain-containing protein [Nitrosopumilus sp.]|nr:redoxin domain-containing protein [Nitrosopumilus sp.]